MYSNRSCQYYKQVFNKRKQTNKDTKFTKKKQKKTYELDKSCPNQYTND